MTDATAHARALLDGGRWADAEAALADACLARPDDPAPRRLLGKLLLQRGEWAAALARLDDGDPEVAFDRAWCLFKLERFAEAAAVAEPLAADSPAAAHLLGRAWLEAGRARDALAPLAACGLPAADLATGWCWYVLGDAHAAAVAWERWMRAGAADWGTKDALSTFHFLLGGGRRPTGRPERPAEPLRDMDHWLRLLARYGRVEDVRAAIARGPRLDPAIWNALRLRWRLTLLDAGLEAEAALLLDGQGIG